MKKMILLALAVMLINGCMNFKYKSKIIRVGTTANYPPIIYKEGKEFKGLEADFAKRMEDDLNAEIIFVETPWEELIPSLKERKVDMIMAGITITPERQKEIAFTEPFLDLGQMTLMKEKSFTKYGMPELICRSDVRIGVESETTGEEFVKTKCKNATAMPFKSVKDAIEALKKDQVEMVIYDGPSVSHYAKQLKKDGIMALYMPLTHEYIAWGVNKDDTKLQHTLNQLLEFWFQKGYLSEAKKKWFPQIITVNIE